MAGVFSFPTATLQLETHFQLKIFQQKKISYWQYFLGPYFRHQSSHQHFPPSFVSFLFFFKIRKRYVSTCSQYRKQSLWKVNSYQQFLPSSLESLGIEWRYAHIVESSGFSNKPSRTVEQHTCQYSGHQYLCQWRCPLSLWHAWNKTVGNSYAEKSNVSDSLGISFHGV